MSMKIRKINSLLFILLPLFSCSQNCYEIIEIKEILYDVSNTEDNNQTTEEYITIETKIDSENDNLYHIFNEDFSLSQNYFGVEITERNSNRRYVKRDSEHFIEQMKHEDHPFLTNPIRTGKKKMIGSFNCVEYILEHNYRTNLTYWIAEDFPFVYTYQHPYKFPGFVVSRQGYSGPDGIIETIYDLKKVKCTEYFKNMIEGIPKNK